MQQELRIGTTFGKRSVRVLERQQCILHSEPAEETRGGALPRTCHSEGMCYLLGRSDPQVLYLRAAYRVCYRIAFTDFCVPWHDTLA